MLSNGIHIGRRGGVRLTGGGGEGQTHLVFTATTTAPSQTVTFVRVQPSGGSVVIDWGDNTTTTVSSGDTASKSRTYAAAGTYTIRISDYERIVQLNINDAKIGGTINATNKLPTGLTYLSLFGTSNLTWTVGASAPMPTGLTYLSLYVLSGLTWTVSASAPMPTGLTTLLFSALSNLTWTVGASAPMPTGLTTLLLNSLSNLTWTVGASASMPTGLTSLNLATLSGLTWTVGASAPMPTGLTSLSLFNLSGLTWTVGASAPMPTGLTSLLFSTLSGLTPIDVWNGINAIRSIRYENNLTQADVDTVLEEIWNNKTNFTWSAPTLDLLGVNNAAPSGTYQAASPPTTGNEYKYDLVNGVYTAAGPEWTVTTA